MSINFETIEFQRFGGETALLNSGTVYLRTKGATGESAQVNGPLDAYVFKELMRRLDHRLYGLGYDAQVLEENARQAIEQLRASVVDFVGADYGAIAQSAGSTLQLDIVAQAAELAQLPFEVLEDNDSPIVVTRRLRRPGLWPTPVHPARGRPRILFAWSSASGSVPHYEHLDALKSIANAYGTTPVCLPNASLQDIADALHPSNEPFSHVHVLAHGGQTPDDDLLQPVAVKAAPKAPFLLCLDGGAVWPAELADVFNQRSDRPSLVTLAACDAAGIDPVVGSQSFAHSLHAAGVPVVVASQLPLTIEGSIELVRVMIARSIAGDDPRQALKDTRSALRNSTVDVHHDDIAVVGYVHLDTEAEFLGSPDRKLRASLARLQATKKVVDAAAAEASPGTLGAVREQYNEVRADLVSLLERDLSNAESEECRGLIASSLKREAEALFKHGEVNEAATVLAEALREYEQAAAGSLDHHWVWVQWLSLVAVGDPAALNNYIGELEVVRLAAERSSGDRHWTIGTLLEVWVISAAVSALAERPCDVNGLAAELAGTCDEIGDSYPLTTTIDQMRRYVDWWSGEPWNVDPGITERAVEVINALEAAAG